MLELIFNPYLLFFFFKYAYKIRKRVNTFKNISRLRRNLLLTLLNK